MATFFKTYDQVGKKEDISDVISNISPTKTPFQSLIKTERVNNTLYQWQEDSLAAVADNAQIEGFTAADSDMAPTVMRSNYTQILQKTVNVSATADVVSTYGRAKETAYQLAKKADELKRELEYHLVGKVQNAAVGNGTSTARTFANAFGTDTASASVIHADVTVTTDSDSGTAGNQAGPLTEANILSVCQKMYEQGSEGKYIMIKPADSLIMAGFAAASGRTRDFQNETKLVNVVDLYVSPFGEQRVILNRFLKATEALVFDPAMWSLVTLRPWTRELLAKTGDFDRHLIVGEYSLKHKNYKGTGRITGLTGSNPTLP
jgi:Family of unknown function (DUF5309)